jgi:hypothetical protein
MVNYFFSLNYSPDHLKTFHCVFDWKQTKQKVKLSKCSISWKDKVVINAQASTYLSAQFIFCLKPILSFNAEKKKSFWTISNLGNGTCAQRLEEALLSQLRHLTDRFFLNKLESNLSSSFYMFANFIIYLEIKGCTSK